MKEKDSLVKIAQEAGFSNLHGLPGLTHWFIGSIVSDDYEIIYFRKNPDTVTGPKNPQTKSSPVISHGTVEIFGIIDPYDYDGCALYRLRTTDLLDANQRKVSHPLNSAVSLDNQTPLFKGKQAVEILRTYKPVSM